MTNVTVSYWQKKINFVWISKRWQIYGGGRVLIKGMPKCSWPLLNNWYEYGFTVPCMYMLTHESELCFVGGIKHSVWSINSRVLFRDRRGGTNNVCNVASTPLSANNNYVQIEAQPTTSVWLLNHKWTIWFLKQNSYESHKLSSPLTLINEFVKQFNILIKHLPRATCVSIW